MITDRVPLAGKDAYLQKDGKVNLAMTGFGTSPKIPTGKQLEVRSLSLYGEGEDLFDLLARKQDDPWLQLTITKEMFPNLFADPFRNRVHTIGGADDLRRGDTDAMRTMEYQGIPTLVSLGAKECRWSSAAYRLPEPISICRVAWHLALSTRTAPDVFQYGLKLEVWSPSQDPDDVHGEVVPITPDEATPSTAPRNVEVYLKKKVAAFRILFTATVKHDTTMQEFHVALGTTESIGCPLLQMVNILEPRSSQFDFASLNELLIQSSQYDLFDKSKPVRFAASVPLGATVTEGEAVSLKVNAKRLKRLEARLDAEVLWRPPTHPQSAGETS